MSGELTISLSSETLDTGSAEERATFGLLAIVANGHLLTEGVETAAQVVRHGPYVAGYPLAEWFLWNWWRIRWEFGRPSEPHAMRRWQFAHSLSTVGDGFVWPKVTIHADGQNAFLSSTPSSDSAAVLYRYLGAHRREQVSIATLESAVDEFVGKVRSRLDADGLRETNVHSLWNDLRNERDDVELTRYRKLEAQLGFDPDDADGRTLQQHLDDAAALGDDALGELASDAVFEDDPLSSMMGAQEIFDIAAKRGYDTDLDCAVSLSKHAALEWRRETRPWRLGEQAARAVRDQEQLDGQRISDEKLAEFGGTIPEAISHTWRCSPNISFVLREGDERGSVSLRSSWKTGRRFELARLIGDRLFSVGIDRFSENLFPATRSHSYRQKLQRAFAAELLSPFPAVDEMLDGDYSEENQSKVARYFAVSPMTIQWQLFNRRRISVQDAPDDFHD